MRSIESTERGIEFMEKLEALLSEYDVAIQFDYSYQAATIDVDFRGTREYWTITGSTMGPEEATGLLVTMNKELKRDF